MATVKQSEQIVEQADAQNKAAEVKEIGSAPKEGEKQPPKRKSKGETSKAAASKKTQPRKTAAKKEPKTKIVMEFAGKQVDVKDALNRALKAYGKSHRGVEVKTVELYIVAEESAGYYVINGEAGNEFRIDL